MDNLSAKYFYLQNLRGNITALNENFYIFLKQTDGDVDFFNAEKQIIGKLDNAADLILLLLKTLEKQKALLNPHVSRDLEL